jgi:hypothetical protein
MLAETILNIPPMTGVVVRAMAVGLVCVNILPPEQLVKYNYIPAEQRRLLLAQTIFGMST